MPRRLDKTLADYMVIAISPALITALVASLTFFLLEVLHQGQFEGRLKWVAFLFVGATVLIARISMEEGAERAMMFGVALMVAVWLAMNKFVDYPPGSFVSNFGWLANLAIMGVVWWSSHQLTWNCTLIDDRQDASGQGLLAVAGLNAESGEAAPPDDGAEGTGDPRRLPSWLPKSLNAWAEQPRVRGLASWFARWIAARRRLSTPGVWVVYFSLAALPIFGLGQALIPAEDLGRRQYVFRLLVIYVASGLGLLLTTSFLGLRRYLRQRKLEMPAPLAGAWLGLGGAMAVALMVAALVIPRPSAEYALSSVTGRVGPSEYAPSQYAVIPPDPVYGQGAAGDQAQPGGQASGAAPTRADGSESTTARPPTEGESEGSTVPSPPGTTQPGSVQPGAAQPGASQPGTSQPGTAQPGASQPGTSQPGTSQPGTTQPGAAQQGAAQPGTGQQSGSQPPNGPPQDAPSSATDPGQDEAGQQSTAQRPPDGQSSSSGQASPTGQRPAEGQGPSAPASGQSPPAGQQPPDAGPSQPPPPVRPPWQMPSLGRMAFLLLRWALNLALAAAVIWLVWKYWGSIVQALRDLWQQLFGGQQPTAAGPAEAPAAPPVVPLPFAAYPDPFVTGAARGWTANQLVGYSFAAVEAWAADRGRPRSPDATPLEFAAELSHAAPPLADDFDELAQAYSRMAYGGQALKPADVAGPLVRLWPRLTALANPAAAGAPGGRA
jgi:hypothetical protein